MITMSVCNKNFSNFSCFDVRCPLQLKLSYKQHHERGKKKKRTRISFICIIIGEVAFSVKNDFYSTTNPSTETKTNKGDKSKIKGR
jgi:hypothetical protein